MSEVYVPGEDIIPSELDGTEYRLNTDYLPEAKDIDYAKWYEKPNQKVGSCSFCGSIYAIASRIGHRVQEKVRVDCDKAFLWAKDNYADTEDCKRKFPDFIDNPPLWLRDRRRGFSPKYAVAAVKYMMKKDLIEVVGVDTGKKYRAGVTFFHVPAGDVEKILRAGFAITIAYTYRQITEGRKTKTNVPEAGKTGTYDHFPQGKKIKSAHMMCIDRWIVSVGRKALTKCQQSWGKTYGFFKDGTFNIPEEELKNAWQKDFWCFVVKRIRES